VGVSACGGQRTPNSKPRTPNLKSSPGGRWMTLSR
jgi:hypothetical protein